MISLEKKDVFDALLRVGKLLELIISNPDDEIAYTIARNYLEYDEQQYYKDYRIFTDLMSLRLLSYSEDSYLDLINNDEINFDEIKNKIFVNSEDSKRFSNKQIIKFIRNAVCHSDENKELFKISPNGRFVEIELKRTKPIPFHIKINNEDLLKIVAVFLPAANGNYCTLVNKEKQVIYRVYLKNVRKDKLSFPKEIVYGTDESLNSIKSFLKEKSIVYEIKEYPLIKEQIELLNYYEERFIGILEQFPEQRETFYLTLYDIVIPLSNEKIYSLFSYLQLFILLYKYPQYTFNQFKNEIVSGYLNAFNEMDDHSINHEDMSELSKFYYDFQMSCGPTLEHYFQTLKYLSSMTEITNNEFLTYYFSCLCKEDIEIGGIVYPKDNIRNSFVHGRHITCLNGDIMCFDTENGKNNDYNFYWNQKLPLKDTIKSCYRNIYDTNITRKSK